MRINFTADDLPDVGTTATDFQLTTNEGNQASLGDYRGKWVVLYFYPKDFTSGCTLEAHNFQRDVEKYIQMNAVILGVSVDILLERIVRSGVVSSRRIVAL
jgi:peroxiredoxin Q/BCP